VTDQRHPQPRPNVWHRPRCNECRDHRKFEQSVNRHPESPSRNPAAVRLNEIRSLRPRGINNQNLVEPTPDNHQRKTFSSNRKQERQRHRWVTSNGSPLNTCNILFSFRLRMWSAAVHRRLYDRPAVLASAFADHSFGVRRSRAASTVLPLHKSLIEHSPTIFSNLPRLTSQEDPP
jgi:hypothetical protein